MDAILVTGGAGFIGSSFVRQWIAEPSISGPSADSPRGQPPALVVNLDKLTYAGNLDSLAEAADHPLHRFVHGDIGDGPLVGRLLAEYRPRAIVHFAAESHVDRSIDGPAAFVETNVVGTFRLLEAARQYWARPGRAASGRRFRFLHVSTDEVYGSLGRDREVQRDDPLRPQLALLGLEGGQRPFCPRLSRHLRPAGPDRAIARTTMGRTSSPKS